jgi:pyrroline-5-carboxylate reductase
MKIAVLGCGKMGGALVRGVVSRGIVATQDVLLSDPHAPSRAALAVDLPGCAQAHSNLEAAAGADVILLCVKPAEVAPVLQELAAAASRDWLVVSIAAGVTLAKMEASLGGRHRVIRVMPNTPALIGKGASAYALGSRATAADAALAEKLLAAVGMVVPVAEKLLDAVTGLSGSGPAYVYTFIEALADGGLLMGLGKEQALKLAAQTVLGAAEMVLASPDHPAKLRDQVTSPGGTTIAGLAKLEELGFRSACIEAVRAATQRSRELGA